jgi:hypothetical protein
MLRVSVINRQKKALASGLLFRALRKPLDPGRKKNGGKIHIFYYISKYTTDKNLFNRRPSVRIPNGSPLTAVRPSGFRTVRF